MTNHVSKVVQAGVRAIKENQNRLGLSWGLHYATTVDSVTDPNSATVLFDGDQTILQAVSLIGVVPNGTRVSVIRLPDGNNYMIGLVNSGKMIQRDTIFISFSALTGTTQAVTFVTPFPTVPSVLTNINSGSGATANWHSRAISITTTGFSYFVFGPSATWVNISCEWVAIS